MCKLTAFYQLCKTIINITIIIFVINNKIIENDDKITTIRIFNNFNDNDNDSDNDDNNNNNNNNKMIPILLLLEHSYSQMTGQ